MKQPSSGLTLIEMLIVTSLLAILFTLGGLLLTNLSRQDRLESTAFKIIAYLNEAQAKTIAGYTLGDPISHNFGLHFESSRLVFFPGPDYQANDPDNQAIALPNDLRINAINLPQDKIVYEKITGEVRGWEASQSSFVLSDQNSVKEINFNFNKYGLVTLSQ